MKNRIFLLDTIFEANNDNRNVVFIHKSVITKKLAYIVKLILKPSYVWFGRASQKLFADSSKIVQCGATMYGVITGK